MAAPFVCFVITQPSMPLKLYGTVKRTRVVLLVHAERAARLDRLACSSSARARSRRRDRAAPAGPVTSSCIGQLPAESGFETRRSASASPLPCIGTTRSALNDDCPFECPSQVAAAERQQRERRCRDRSDRPAAARQERELDDLGFAARRAAARARAAGRAAGRPARAARARGAAAPPRPGRGPSAVDQILEVAQLEVVSEDRRARRLSAARVRVLTVPSGMPRNSATSTLREAAPVGERDHLALALRQLLERPVHAPRDPALLGAVGRAGFVRRLVRDLRRHIGARARAVDDRVAGDGVEPRRARARDRAGTSPAERQIEANVSCTASSARPRSPSRRSARPKTGRA